jgi:hypothetical protein
MSKSTRRALRVSLTVSGIAVLCASFVGTAAASPSIDDAQNPVGNSSPEVPSPDKVTGVLPEGVPDVASVEPPRIGGASYYATDLTVVPASDPGNNEDEDHICHGLNRKHEFEKDLKDKLKDQDAKVQHPCQSSGNDIQDGTFEVHGTPVAAPASFPGVDTDGDNDVNRDQSGDSAAPLPDPNAATKADPNAVTKGLQAPLEDPTHVKDQHVAVTPA